MSKEKKNKIAILGFEEAGIKTFSSFSDDFYDYFYVATSSDPKVLENCVGVVVPTGAFEEIKEAPEIGQEVSLTEQSLISHWLREIIIRHAKGMWICLLADEIRDNLIVGFYQEQLLDISENDLIKKILNHFGITKRYADKPQTPLLCKSDEFRKYFESHAVAHTIFSNLHSLTKSGELRVICGDIQRATAFSYDSKLFVLPIHTDGMSQDARVSAIKMIGAGIHSFKSKNTYHLPQWLGAIEIDEEAVVKDKYDQAMVITAGAANRLNVLESYKGILTNSNSILCKLLAEFLTKEFGLNVKIKEEFVQDFTLLDNQSQIIAVCESKGVKGGVIRDHISQVDSFRNRLEISPTTPGVLCINDFMEVESLEERLSKKVDPMHIKKAVNDNVLILRTSDLLAFYLGNQKVPLEKRRSDLLSFINAQGGQMKFESGSFQVVKS